MSGFYYRHRKTGTVYRVLRTGTSTWGAHFQTTLESPGGRLRHLTDHELGNEFEAIEDPE